MKQIFIAISIFLLFPLLVMGQNQTSESDSLVEVSGVVMTSDSLLEIPNVTVRVKGSQRGLMTNGEGVFSIVVKKGHTLAFSVIGFKPKETFIPEDYDGNFMSIAILLSQDTTYLPPMVVHSYPSREEFEEAFLHWTLPSDLFQLANANISPEKLQAEMYFTPPDGGEGVHRTFEQNYQQRRSKGQMPTMNIFNPLAWAEFIKSIKDGDYKSQ